MGFKQEQLDDPEYELEKLIRDVVEAVKPFENSSGKKISVIAAGGVYTGADIHKFFELGASGVQMGTRFVATDECDADIDFKRTYINARKEDIQIIKSPVGLPGRVIRNSFVDAMQRGEKEPFRCPYHCIITCDYQKSPYCIALALMNAKRGNLAHGFPFAGANAYRVDRIIPVKELIDTLVEEYVQARASS